MTISKNETTENLVLFQFSLAKLESFIVESKVLIKKITEQVKFIFSKKTTKINEIFTIDLTVCSKCQIDGEDIVNFCGLLRKHELFNWINLSGKQYCFFETMS